MILVNDVRSFEEEMSIQFYPIQSCAIRAPSLLLILTMLFHILLGTFLFWLILLDTLPFHG